MHRLVRVLGLVVTAAALSAACSQEDDEVAPTDAVGDGGTAAVALPNPERCATPPCANGERCKDPVDCQTSLCIDRVCLPATAVDGQKNGGETDVDCGGPPEGAARCATGKACVVGADCRGELCESGTCQPTASDGEKNGTETDVDCGGGAPTNARRCATGEACTESADCDAVACSAGTCDVPTSGDAIKNGTETDVDCGGGAPTNAPACALDQTCAVHGDCASSACGVSGPKAGRCVPFKSCVKNEGGFTCGRDDRDFGGVPVALESCCETAPIDGSQRRVNRFSITAGRMRAFVERLGGNVRSFVQNAATRPPGWSAAWDALVPSNVAEAETMLGPYWNGAPNDPNTTTEAPHSKRSCGYANFNGHTYWVSTNTAQQVFSQAVLDTKALNCVGWHMVRAFCHWDGGRMATQAELRNVFTNGNVTTHPWLYAGSPFTAPYSPTVPDARLNHRFTYGFPGAEPASKRITWWLSPPGRFWQGWNKNKVEIAGNTLEWTGDVEYGFAWNYSFENHEGTMNNGGDWRSPNDRTDVPNGYYALGARCVY